MARTRTKLQQPDSPAISRIRLGLRARQVAGVLVFYGTQRGIRDAFHALEEAKLRISDALECIIVAAERSPLSRYLFVTCAADAPGICQKVQSRLSRFRIVPLMMTCWSCKEKNKRKLIHMPGVLIPSEWRAFVSDVASLDSAQFDKINVGSNVIITGGAFKGFPGVVTRRTGDMVTVSLTIFGRAVQQAVSVELLRT